MSPEPSDIQATVARELASSAVRFFERVSERLSAAPLARVGLTREQVRQLLAASAAQVSPVERRRQMVRRVRACGRGMWGRKGMPEDVWRAMYAEYCTGLSCTAVAAVFGGTRQSVHEIFKARGLKLRPRHLRLHPKIEYGGRAYTPGKSGYYRATEGDRRMLHHAMWEDAHGPIPEGWQVTFRNADHTDLRLDNMECMPIAAVTRFHRARHLRAEGKAA